jgi:hypothetical protein
MPANSSSGAGFSLWVFVLARTKTHRLKPMPVRLSLAELLILSFASALASAQQPTPKATPSPAPNRNLSGLWHYEGTGASEPIAPDNLIPAMTPWAQAKFDAERPGYGPRRAPGGNDPILQCDPMGFPRIMFLNTPFEFVQAPGRVIQFFEHEHEYRSIWTDGRTLPKDGDADPTWYGYAIGHWEGDDTLVVESTGFIDTTWLGSTGYPHSRTMRVTERYHRTDHDTIAYEITISDSKVYVQPIVGPHRIMKLRPKDEMVEEICVHSEEKSFANRIAEPATPKPSKVPVDPRKSTVP